MKEKAILISVAALLVLAIPAFAMAPGSQSITVRPVVTNYGLLGKGIAVLPSDLNAFKIVKVGIGTVRVYLLGEYTDITIGVMYLDDQKYVLKDVVISNGSVTAKVYLNETMVGSLSASSVIKGDAAVWAGTLSVSDATYYLYILEASRPIKPAELKQKVSEYCSETDDSKCTSNIDEFCANNPTDTRCLALFKAYCLTRNNMDDARCREFMNSLCQNNSESENCTAFIIQTSGAYCAAHPGTAVCKAIEQKIMNYNIGVNNYCAEHSDTIGCKTFCRKFPDKCKATEPEVPEEEQPSEAELACTDSGGTVANASCCTSASDFPNICLIGACGCAAEDSHEVSTCDCGSGNCFNGIVCIAQEMNETQGGL